MAGHVTMSTKRDVSLKRTDKDPIYSRFWELTSNDEANKYKALEESLMMKIQSQVAEISSSTLDVCLVFKTEVCFTKCFH
ncbi:hypothetical protein DPMN_123061 [Dreissena polymorpha]|uniref:Uncharacterized protein n=1 Tax=Dreissena polymorpha TaxID=45954 RepID=A0A9D4JUS4_DREPO|nr:hypothetical protein DPMN_123061 [Dreissena polymorpha]